MFIVWSEWSIRARSIQPKFRNRSDREKWSTSKGGPVFSKFFRLDRTDPLSFGPKFPEILVEWIALYVYDPPALSWVVRFYHVNTVGSSLWNCLAPRPSLSIKFSPLIFLFPIVPCASLTVTCVALAFRAHLCAKNEGPEEEVDSGTKLIPE